MKLKLPPLLIFVIFLGLMYFLSKYLPIGDFEFFGSEYLVFTLVGIAILITLISVLQFFRSKTTIDPRSPSKVSKLVTYGVYKFSKNPIHLSCSFPFKYFPENISLLSGYHQVQLPTLSFFSNPPRLMSIWRNTAS